MRRGLATIVTLTLLSTFLFAIVLGVMLAVGVVSLPLAAALVVLLNFGILLVSPTISDFVYGWLYGLEWITIEELRDRSPESAAVIETVTEEYGYAQPRLGLIPDSNPTAFTYGSARFNGRIVVTEGIFEYLDDEEAASVVAHELGHITSRDFIIMTLANTIVQLLYLLAIYSWRIAARGGSGGGNRGRAAGALYGVAVLSYVLWFVGEYMVLYLSRVREYAADAFSAEYTHPDALSSALVKIAYGIVMSEDDPELEKATRNLGIVNIDKSKTEGIIYHNTREAGGDPDLLLRSFLFDLKNPWAKLLELNSTHPLTGKRVERLSGMDRAERFDFADIERRLDVDRGRLWRNFARDLAALALPMVLAVTFPLLYLGAVVLDAVVFSIFALAGGWLLSVGLAMIAQTLYKYPPDEGEATTVLELLGDVYASPVRGRTAELSGKLIGRGRAGYRFSEDLMFQDGTGLMYVKYEHWLPVIGNFLFSVKRVPELIGEEVTVDGWYLRGVSPWLGQRELRAGDETIRGFIHLGGYVAGGLLTLLGLVLVVVGL